MVIKVLLKVELTCAIPELMFFRSFLRVRVAGFAMSAYVRYVVILFLPATGLDGPFRVRALV